MLDKQRAQLEKEGMTAEREWRLENLVRFFLAKRPDSDLVPSPVPTPI